MTNSDRARDIVERMGLNSICAERKTIVKQITKALDEAQREILDKVIDQLRKIKGNENE